MFHIPLRFNVKKFTSFTHYLAVVVRNNHGTQLQPHFIPGSVKAL